VEGGRGGGILTEENSHIILVLHQRLQLARGHVLNLVIVSIKGGALEA
jgi:hypothetical protein